MNEEHVFGVSSFSAPTAFECPKRLDRSLLNLKKIGWSYVEGQCLRSKFGRHPGTSEQRQNDFHSFLSAPELTGIISAIGGHSSISLIEGIDYDLVRQNPKKIIGYSDFSVILNAIFSRSRIETYLGPALLPQFGEPMGLDTFTERSLIEAFSGKAYSIEDAKWFSDEWIEWDREDISPRKQLPSTGRTLIRDGVGTGVVVGGNLDSICSILNTPYFPHDPELVLLLEESEEINMDLFERNLYQLRISGVLDRVNAILIGRLPTSNFKQATQKEIQNLLLVAFEGFSFPVISNLSFGHTYPMLTIPIGRWATITHNTIQIHSTLYQPQSSSVA